MAPAAAAGNPERPGGNCVKIGLPGKSILRDYFQESGTSQRHFPYLESIFYRLPNDCRPGRLLDSEIIIDFKIMCSPTIGADCVDNRLESLGIG